MNIKKRKFLFAPRNKPKSWVLGKLAFLTSLFIAMPILAAGFHFNLWIIKGLGMFLFVFCGITYACMETIYSVNKFNGKYSCIEERDWKDQVW